MDRLSRIQNSKIYKGIYFTMYYWLALNDHFKMIFIPPSADVIFLTVTILFLILFVADIICRSIAEKGYVCRFFFFVDLAAVIIIAYSSFVSDISIFITLSFLKIIMIIRTTDIVIAYKQVG